MNELSHLFVFEEVKKEKEINDNLKSFYELKAIFKREVSNQEIKLNTQEVEFLVRNWTSYTGESPDFIAQEENSFSWRVRDVFNVLKENLAEGEIPAKDIVEQNNQFGKAIRALKK